MRAAVNESMDMVDYGAWIQIRVSSFMSLLFTSSLLVNFSIFEFLYQERRENDSYTSRTPEGIKQDHS